MFLRLTFLIVATIVCIALPAAAQTGHTHQPYAGLQERGVKSLSPQQVADLRAGRGMGMAMAAELNGYPGPLHVLEHADSLRLSPDQRSRTAALFDSMKHEAGSLGERLIREESELDQLFASGSVTSPALDAATGAIGATQGALRATHLRYHLAMMAVLTPHQVAQYRILRGYAAAPGPHGR